MIETASQAARFLHTALGCGLLGIPVFMLILELRDGRELYAWRERWIRSTLAMAAAYLLAGGIVFAGQLRAVVDAGLGDPAVWIRYALGTRFGRTWLFQHGMAVLLLFHLAMRQYAAAALGWRLYLAAGAALALLAVPASSFAGHGAADDAAAIAIAANWTHIVAVSLWAGALPIPLAVIVGAVHDASGARCAGAVLRHFSGLALVAVLCLVASGLVVAWLQVGSIPALLGTIYGQLLALKLLLLTAILAIAAHLRWRTLPRIDEALATPSGKRRVVAWLVGETMLVLAAIALASSLSALPPAQHEPIVWPLTLRFAPNIAWSQSGAPDYALASMLVAAAAVGAGWWQRRRATVIGRYGVCVLLLLGGLAIALPALTVPANPDTYRRSAVAYDVFSIANGERLFRQNCVICHGVNATGNGEAAASTPRPPADLTAPHARDHTAGDMYWWVSHGIPAGGMPGFADSLAEDERWDVVNFLHTLATGYQARMIRESIAPRAPWLAAPDFVLATATGETVHLQDYGRRLEVLLVLYSLPGSAPRLEQLRRAADLFVRAGLTATMVPIGSMPEDETSGTDEQIAAAYRLFRRTLVNSRAGEAGAGPAHMEFLIDRYGFIRARWVPEDGTAGWADLSVLMAEIRALAAEGRVRGPPDAHLH